MGLLEKHQKTNIRYQNKDVIFYEPTDEQLQEIKSIVQNTIKKTQNEIQIDNELDMKSTRFIIRELTNVGNEIDEYSDEQLKEKLDNGDRVIKILVREITKFINEILDDLLEEQIENVKSFNTLMNLFNNNQDIKTLEIKLNKFLKKNKINMKFEDFMNLKDNPQAIDELTKKLNKNIK